MKVNRHAKIIELINKYHIETQEELAEYKDTFRKWKTEICTAPA